MGWRQAVGLKGSMHMHLGQDVMGTNLPVKANGIFPGFVFVLGRSWYDSFLCG